MEQAQSCEIKEYREFFKNHFDHYLYDRTKQSIYTKLQSLLNSQLFLQMTTGLSTVDLDREVRKGSVILINL